MPIIGSICFGLVIGWLTYRTMRRNTEAVQLSDIATVIGAVGGAAVLAIFDDPNLFGAYCVGLSIGFFGYLAVGIKIEGPETAASWLGDRTSRR